MFSPVNLYVLCLCTAVYGCFHIMSKKNERKVNRAQSFLSFNSQHATSSGAEQVSVYFQYAMLPSRATNLRLRKKCAIDILREKENKLLPCNIHLSCYFLFSIFL